VGVAVTAHTRIKSKQPMHCIRASQMCKNIEGDVGKGAASGHDLLAVSGLYACELASSSKLWFGQTSNAESVNRKYTSGLRML
jgi:hypothetical protein